MMNSGHATNSAAVARTLVGAALAAALTEARHRTLTLVEDLTPAQWLPPYQPGVNPIAWELAHLAWFAEFWILRGPHSRSTDGFAQAQRPPQFAGPDALFDSARLAHAKRWTEPMPTRRQLARMMQGQLDACIAALPPDAGDASPAESDAAHYFHRLALFHEDMHGEAFCWLRHNLGYPAPAGMAVPQVPVSAPLSVPGGKVQIGYGMRSAGFAFDNESPSRAVSLKGFVVDSAPVGALDFARFVDAGGYQNALYWPCDAGAWLAQSGLKHPKHWRQSPGGEWQLRWFDTWLALPPNAPAMHLNAYEAGAYCLWSGARLPTAAEWEHAAQNHAGFHWGHSVWEWTADAFAPYPGFTPGPYCEYSEPWFGDHRELRGGAFATHARMHHPCYRNFFQPHRSDIFAGFRTVAL